MHKRIIVAVFGDDAPSRDATALGVSLARIARAELTLAAIWSSPLGAGDLTYEMLVRGEIEREVGAMRKLVPSDVRVRTVVAGATSALRGLHRIAATRHDDVLVFSAGQLRHGTHRTLALDALHDAPCVVAVAPAGYSDHEAELSRDVVLAWDESPEAHVALEEAVRIADRTGGTLRLVTVLGVGYRFADEPIVDAEGKRHWLASLRPLAQETLDRGVALVGSRVPVSTAIREGLTGEELAEAARDAAFVVAGSRGYGTLRRLVVGSTTADLLRHATVPVVVLPRAAAEREAAVREAVSSWHER